MDRKVRKYSINDLDSLIASIKSSHNLIEEEIAVQLGYNEGYISQTRARGFVPDKFMEALKNRFAKSNDLGAEKKIETVLPSNGPTIDFKDKYIASLEREVERLKRDLELSLGELRHNQLLGRAILETNQDILVELLTKQRKQPLDLIDEEVSKANIETYTRLKEEGSFPYVGK